jgi:nucleotide-binding universal stress UspA family protein
VISSILIPTDFSPASWNATMLGLEIAKWNNCKLSLLHVFPMVSRYSKQKNEIELPTKLEELKQKMKEFAQNLDEEGSKEIINVVLPGNVEDTMISYIKENNFDMVIVGVNGNGENNELGSHTASLIEKSGTPVLIVPNLKNKSSQNGAAVAG